MPYDAKVFQVMIAGPSDVARERQLIKSVLWEWNDIHSEKTNIVLLPIGWETHTSPSLDDRPQKIINKDVLQKADLLVCLFWTRLGTPTDEYPSGSVEEIKHHEAAGKPTMLYFSSEPVAPQSIDSKQFDALKRFEEQMRQKGITSSFDSASDLKDKFTRDLQHKIYNHPHFNINEDIASNNIEHLQKVDDVSQTISVLSAEAKELLIAASHDEGGTIMYLKVMGGNYIQSNDTVFNEIGNMRSEALWASALEQLINLDLVRDEGYKGEIFILTNKGYTIADNLSK